MFLSAQPHKRELNGDGGHWYYPDGRSLHTVPKKDGTGERNTTKADARKLGLFPSVTAITKIVANPSLDRWKQNQMLEACVNNPIVGGENTEEYGDKMRQFAQKKMVDARAFGSLYHNAIDELNKTGFLDNKYDEIKPFVKYYIEWTRDHGLAVVDGKLTLLDYKTQDVKEDVKGNLKPNYYDSWVWQLAAYKNAEWENKPPRIQQVMSVVLCSQSPCYPIMNYQMLGRYSKPAALYGSLQTNSTPLKMLS